MAASISMYVSAYIHVMYDRMWLVVQKVSSLKAKRLCRYFGLFRELIIVPVSVESNYESCANLILIASCLC